MKIYICFCLFLCAAATAAFGDPFYAIPGITGSDGELPLVEGELPVITGLALRANGGDVSVYFAGWASAYTDVVKLGDDTLFVNNTTPLGSSVDLGNFSSGQLLNFSMFVENTHETWYLGPAAQNSDKTVHAAYAPWAATTAMPFNGVFVGWEDLPACGDCDLNDAMMLVRGAGGGTAATPEPGTAALVGSFLLLLALYSLTESRRRRAPNTTRY